MHPSFLWPSIYALLLECKVPIFYEMFCFINVFVVNPCTYIDQANHVYRVPVWEQNLEQENIFFLCLNLIKTTEEIAAQYFLCLLPFNQIHPTYLSNQ